MFLKNRWAPPAKDPFVKSPGLGVTRAEIKDHSHSLYVESEASGTSLVVQRLRLHAPNAGGPGLSPGQETRSCEDKPRLKIPHATNIANKYFFLKVQQAGKQDHRSKLHPLKKSTLSVSKCIES